MYRKFRDKNNINLSVLYGFNINGVTAITLMLVLTGNYKV